MITAEITPSNISVLVAFGGGIISILSPCVLPLIPGYLSLVSGLTVAELQEGARNRMGRIAATTGLFALGFTVVFTLIGLAATSIGQAVFRNQELLTRVSGVVVIVMAMYLAGSQLVTAPRWYPEARLHVTDRFGMATAPLAGAAFALGWSPCLGPVLAAITSVAATQSGPRAVSLLVAYSAGMGAAFLLVGLAFGRWAAPLDWVKRHLRTITLVSAGILALFGVLLVLDRLWWLTARLTDALDALGLERLVELG